MKLAYVEFCGFRGYRNHLHIKFSDGFTIIDGRNGVGKSTVFDAVEFALTGTIAKYGDVKADGETVADYIWWSGKDYVPDDRYVEIGFQDGGELLKIRRSQLSDVDGDSFNAIVSRLCDMKNSPKSPLAQLFNATIIRDEHIADLSLDMKEGDRYALLCNAIGATDADAWIARGLTLLNFMKKRVQSAEKEVAAAAGGLLSAVRRIDEIRGSIVDDAKLLAAALRLQAFANSTLAPDKLIEPSRVVIAEKTRQMEKISYFIEHLNEFRLMQKQLSELKNSLLEAHGKKVRAEEAFSGLVLEHEISENSDVLSQQARDIAALVSFGRKLGLRDSHCPLCATNQTEEAFLNGLVLAEDYAKQLDRKAFDRAQLERIRKQVEEEVFTAKQVLERCEHAVMGMEINISKFEKDLSAIGFAADVNVDDLIDMQKKICAELDVAREDLGIIETIKLNTQLEQALHAENEARDAHGRAQDRLSLANRAERHAQALYDAARRSAGETLDGRLDRVLPLMAELYGRLRPHPIWSDIEYKIRGDVKRYMRLQVGDELNPQFMFSSGQRRATGLAFLLSVNLSLTWSRWKTIMLDDPVQHVDDFRSVQLAEVMAQLSVDGKQIICAVEDEALADLLCRRLPINNLGQGKRVTLGADHDGALTKLRDEELSPFLSRALVTGGGQMAG